MKHILVTGGSSFVARALFPKLMTETWKIRTTLRREQDAAKLPDGIERYILGDLENLQNWKPILDGVDVVIHLVARVHQMAEKVESGQAYQKVNVELTKNLAQEAAKARVKRFIFLSSVKVLGEETFSGQAWDEDSPCFPEDLYGQSKYDAEQILRDIALKTPLEMVILRLPLLYGPGLKANMVRLFNVVDRGLPLPLGGVQNARSLLFVGNLVDAIRITLEHPKAKGQTFFVSDGEDISTPELIRQIAHALGRPVRLLSCPPTLLRLAGKLTAQSQIINRLLNSLVIDSTKIRHQLDWRPPFSMTQGLQKTSEWYRSATK